MEIKTNKWDIIKLKSFCIAKETINKVKRTHRMEENNSKWNNWQRINFPNMQAAHGLPPGSVVKNLPHFRRCRFNPWVGKIPCRKKWQPTPVFLPGESHGQRSLAGYSGESMGSQSRTRLSDWKAEQHKQLIQINTRENKPPDQKMGKRPKQTFLQRRHFVVVQSPWRVWLFTTPWTVAHQASLSFTISQSLPKFMSTAPVMLSNHLILWFPLLLLPSIFPSIRDFSKE